ncbi:MAG: hypothetical protein AAB839_00350 [Patescibacteria group bacterium]
MEDSNGLSKKSAAIIAAIVILLALVVFAVMSVPSSEEQETASTNTETVPATITTATTPVTTETTGSSTDTTDPTPTDATSSYKDGTYTAVGDYRSPAGAETIDVSITLKNDIIVDATVTANATNAKSVTLQGAFISGYKVLVIGKNIDDVMLDKVSGSSLTPVGFNEALVEIKADAAV